jgi:ion channel-forming bestrophin family protein
MLTKKRYSLIEMVLWTRWETIWFLALSLIVAVLYQILGLTFLQVPWTPVALIGTAVAFIVGFQNNSAYGRIWEARKIWGGMVNVSRVWAMKTRDMITNEHADEPVADEKLQDFKRVFVYRHIAWLTAMRHAMRQTRTWEVFEEHHTNREWADAIHVPERLTSLEDDLIPYLSPEECEYVRSKNNRAASILFLQSRQLRELKENRLIWEFSFLELQKLLEKMFELQGKSERIKNFPYPRQYATLGHYFVWIFLILLPFGILPEFARIGEGMEKSFPLIGDNLIWLGVPFCGVVSWVFHTMERIGRVGENPFEGSVNDVPISTIARGIEIDLRQMLGENIDNIPKQFPKKKDVQM